MPFKNSKPYERWDVRKAREKREEAKIAESLKRPIGRPRKDYVPPEPIVLGPPSPPQCRYCGSLILPKPGKSISNVLKRKYCSQSCLAKRKVRRQLAWEKEMSERMEKDGWTMIRPMSCCDRIGIKDGKVFFVEFKTETDHMREFQSLVQGLAPDMYKIVVGKWQSMD